MLYATPRPDADLAERLDALDVLRRRLAIHAGGGTPWLGRLRRDWRASSARSSIEIEGFRVSADEARAAVEGRARAPETEGQLALACYARAMDHVGVLTGDPRFRWCDRVVLDLHFDVCHFQRDRSPGRFREELIAVTAPEGGPPAFVGPASADVPALMDEVVAWLANGDLDAHVSVRAAMAHLHVVSVHPFRDGNGRVSRIVQSAVLAREGPLAPEFVSIEEHLGRHTGAYYDALRTVQGGSYAPDRDATPWVRFCVDAQIAQMRARLDQIVEAGRRWAILEELVADRGWPDRAAIALQESLLAGVDRATYAAAADLGLQTATNDLRRLVDGRLVRQVGRGRSTRYVATDALGERLALATDEDD